MSTIKNSLLFLILAIGLLISCGEEVVKYEELKIGAPTQIINLNVQGSNLPSFINTKLLSDTSRNLLIQLGEYKFSTSIDSENSYDNRYNPDVNIFYTYEGLELKYTGKGAGLVQREALQATLEDFPQSFYLEEIYIEPQKYKGTLPKGITAKSTPSEIEKLLGKHNTFFDSGGNTERVRFKYPEYGLSVLFNHYPGSVSSDSSIYMITIVDPVKEMKRYPTLYPNIK